MMSLESSILLRLARPSLGPEEGAGLSEEVRRGLRWAELLALSVRHRVFSVCYRNLGLYAAGAVPPQLWTEMRSMSLGNLAQNVRAAKALTGVMQRLKNAGVRAAAYKGPVLAVSAYGSLGSRSFNDLDIYIVRHDLERALSLLVEMGYRPEGGSASALTPLTLRFLRDIVLRDGRGRIALEVQWRIAQRYHPVYPRPEELLGRSVTVEVEGAPLRTFSPEDTLLILCLHGLYHAWSQLQMVTDVAQVIRALSPDWDLTLELARENHARRILFLGLLLARKLLGCELPGSIRAAALEERSLSVLADEVGEGMFAARAPSLRARRLFFREAEMFPSRLSRARYVFGRLTTPNEEDLAGRPLTWPRLLLLPFRRLLRLFRTYALKGRA